MPGCGHRRDHDNGSSHYDAAADYYNHHNNHDDHDHHTAAHDDDYDDCGATPSPDDVATAHDGTAADHHLAAHHNDDTGTDYDCSPRRDFDDHNRDTVDYDDDG